MVNNECYDLQAGAHELSWTLSNINHSQKEPHAVNAGFLSTVLFWCFTTAIPRGLGAPSHAAGDYSLNQMAVLLLVLSLLAALAQLMQKPLARFITNWGQEMSEVSRWEPQGVVKHHQPLIRWESQQIYHLKLTMQGPEHGFTVYTGDCSAQRHISVEYLSKNRMDRKT